MQPARPSAASRKVLAQYHHLAQNFRELEEDLRWGLEDSPRIPAEWHVIAQRPDVPFKTKITLRLDGDVIAFFKAMGRGHLTRMNAVLRAFMQARLAGVVKGAEDVAYQPTAMEVYLIGAAELAQEISRLNARMLAGHDVIANNMAIDRRKIRLMQMEDNDEIPADWRIKWKEIGL